MEQENLNLDIDYINIHKPKKKAKMINLLKILCIIISCMDHFIAINVMLSLRIIQLNSYWILNILLQILISRNLNIQDVLKNRIFFHLLK